MDAELEQHLISEYPMLYEYCTLPDDEVPDPVPPVVLDGIACGDGWFGLVDTVSGFLESHLNDHPDRPAVRVVQVKQKWGGLRMYIDPTPELAYGAILLAEQVSRTTCENCGTTDHVEATETDGWRAALCPACDPPTNY